MKLEVNSERKAATMFHAAVRVYSKLRLNIYGIHLYSSANIVSLSGNGKTVIQLFIFRVY